jgi:hypothetical protein
MEAGVKTTVFWVLAPCSSEIVRRFGGTYCLKLQGRIVSQARNQQKQATSWAVSKLHGVTTQKTVFSYVFIYLFHGAFQFVISKAGMME